MMLPKTSTYVKCYNVATKWLCFFQWIWLIIEKGTWLWTYRWQKNLKTKIKSSGDEATENHDKEILKVGSNYTC